MNTNKNNSDNVQETKNKRKRRRCKKTGGIKRLKQMTPAQMLDDVALDLFPPEFARNGKLTYQQKRFLTAYMQCFNVRAASDACGLHPNTPYAHWRLEEEYIKWFKWCSVAAARLQKERLETEALRRAMEGEVRYKFDKNGNPLVHPVTGEFYCEREYDNGLLIFMLKAANPRKYNVVGSGKVEHSGLVEHSHYSAIPVDKLSTETKRKLLEEIEAIEQQVEASLENRGQVIDVTPSATLTTPEENTSQ